VVRTVAMTVREVAAEFVGAQDVLYDVKDLENVLRDLYGQITAQAQVINAGVETLDTPKLKLKLAQAGQYRLSLEAQVVTRFDPGPFIRYRCDRSDCGLEVWGAAFAVANHIVAHTRS
jgi:hypothetical protein